MTTRDAGTAAGANALPDGPITGGEALARMLLAHGIGPLFGMGGFQLLPFYDACRRLGLSHALINDERCGAFAADAYARVTGRVGVCDATLGPGATNLVTALVESYNAGVPIVAIVGDTHRDHSWKNMTQETRQVEMLRPAVKEVIRVEIGERNRIREHVTINAGTAGGGGLTRVGDDCLLMAGCHVAHDCHVGNRVIIVNQAVMGGHCIIGDDAIIGGMSALHQFVRVGRGAMIGGRRTSDQRPGAWTGRLHERLFHDFS